MLINDLTEILGEQDATKLMTQFAGLRLYVPANFEDKNPICELLGDDSSKLHQKYGGNYLSFPLNQKWIKEKRIERIHHLRLEGWTLQSIGREVGCSERWVRIVLQRHPCNKSLN